MQPPTPSRTADSDPSRRGLDASPAATSIAGVPVLVMAALAGWA